MRGRVPISVSAPMGESVWLREARAFTRGAVATPHYLASAAGARVLATGGNAVDAAVAANLVLGVVVPYMCGFGGDLMAMVWDGAVRAYRGAGRAPAAATSAKIRDLSETRTMPVLGPHTVTVPGAVEGWFALLDEWGTRSFGDLAADALRYADEGFVPTRRGAWFFESVAGAYDASGLPDFRTAYGTVAAGVPIRQPALGGLIRTLADEGPDPFYRGRIGEAIAARVAAAGGLLATDDLAAHRGEWVAPLHARFRDLEVFEHPPPTQGMTALGALRIIDGLDPGSDGPDRQHLLIEALRIALSDRATHLGDPGAMTVDPTDFLAEEAVAARRRSIDPRRTTVPAPAPAPDGGTVYLCAADGDGLMVSLIQSNFFAAGSGLRVPEWGVNLYNRGSGFVLEDGHPHAIGPRKYPLHTLIPALALRDGAPGFVFGTEGAHGQAQTHVQLLTRIAVDRSDPQAAISAPRFTIDPGSGEVAIEDHMDEAWIADLERRGHRIRRVPAYRHGPGIAHLIEKTVSGLRAASDPRAEGGVAGW